jgi:ribose 5-phosphate isomerase B
MNPSNQKIFIGADHAGFEVKEELKKYLADLGFSVEDLGNLILDQTDDYPDVIVPVAEAVAKNSDSMGIVIGGSGQGEAIAANKIKGIRAAVVYDEYSARMSRMDNDANVASFGARVLDIEKIKELLLIWLNTPFSNEERHQRRIEKLNNL